jgi:N-acetylmuramoyl-L-alanine amidase
MRRLASLLFLVTVAWASAQTICIDPGHPSENGIGTRGKVLTEVGVAWKVALLLKEKLENEGYTVVLTKSKEREKVTNARRAEIANKAKADLMLRLHCDAGTKSGFATYYPDRQGTVRGITGPSRAVIASSTAAAKKFHPAVIKALNKELVNSGLHPDTKTKIGGEQGALTGSILSKVPVVLVEMVVLQNPKDEAFLLKRNGMEKLAQAMLAGVKATVPRKTTK